MGLLSVQSDDAVHVHVLEVRLLQALGAGEVAAQQLELLEGGALEVGASEVTVLETAAMEVGVGQVRVAEVHLGQVAALPFAAHQSQARQVGVGGEELGEGRARVLGRHLAGLAQPVPFGASVL